MVGADLGAVRDEVAGPLAAERARVGGRVHQQVGRVPGGGAALDRGGAGGDGGGGGEVLPVREIEGR